MNNIDKIREANTRIAELEELFKVNQHDIRETAQQALGYEQTVDALGAVRRLADKCKELEAQLAEADKQKERLRKQLGQSLEFTELAKAGSARFRAALERLEWSKRVAFTDIMQCPVCLEWPSTGHKPDCFISAALRPDEQQTKTTKENSMNEFEKELETLINKHSQENASNTPDFILAQYLNSCLLAFNTATQQRETWYGRDARPTCDEQPAAK